MQCSFFQNKSKSQFIFRPANHTNVNNSQSEALSHTPLTVLLLVTRLGLCISLKCPLLSRLAAKGRDHGDRQGRHHIPSQAHHMSSNTSILTANLTFGQLGHLLLTEVSNYTNSLLWDLITHPWLEFDVSEIWPQSRNWLFSCDQAALWMVQSVCLSVCLSVCPSVTPFWLCSYQRIIMKFSGVITNDKSDVHAKVKVRGQRSRSQRSRPNLTVSGL